jgi:cytoskeletal protein CcmA (bactofilin family)
MSMIKRDEPMPTTNASTGPATPPPSPASADLLLGAGAEFEGKLRFKGTVRIDALFKGQIVTNDVLVVGENARIDAEITCGTVIVHGEVNGDIKAKTAVEVLRTAKVHGNVETPSLRLDKGGKLDGSVKMTPGERAAAAPDQKLAAGAK